MPGQGSPHTGARLDAAPTWRGYCTSCFREGLEVGSRRAHHERVMCGVCAARPAPPLLAVPGSVPVVTSFSDSTWAAWDRERRQAAAKDRASRPVDLARLAALLTEAKLRPIIDEELGLVSADCPACQAGDGLWRPYSIVPRRGKVLAACDACGIEEVERV